MNVLAEDAGLSAGTVGRHGPAGLAGAERIDSDGAVLTPDQTRGYNVGDVRGGGCGLHR